jgi:hypothetical protein
MLKCWGSQAQPQPRQELDIKGAKMPTIDLLVCRIRIAYHRLNAGTQQIAQYK